MADRMRIALYLRLSLEDEKEGEESGSIANQRILLRRFLSENFQDVLYEPLEFVDDGYSGTSLNRPAVTELLKEAECGNIDCILVKDFSRFSRDYIEMGTYLERVFPVWGIRFISVNESYDSRECAGKLLQFDTAFWQLVNDLYVKDISVKVKSSLEAKKENGIYANGSTPFGYRKSEKDCHELIPAEPEAGIVRRIFQMAAEGRSSLQIARRLNAEGIRTPIEHKMARGMVSVKPKGRKFLWSDSSVRRILQSAFYAGDLVYGKYETKTAGEKARSKPREEWKICKDHHEPLVDRKTYELAQKSRRRGKQVPGRKKHALTGKAVCGCCGKNLKIVNGKNACFFCPVRYQTFPPECTVQIFAAEAEKMILYLLRREIIRGADRDRLRRTCVETLSKRRSEVLRKKDWISKEKDRLQTENARAYERYRKKEYTREEYKEILRRFQREEERLSDMEADQERRYKRIEAHLAEIAKNAGERAVIGVITKLDRDMADLFVKELTVRDEKHVEIRWNFQDPAEGHFFDT